MIEGIGHIQKQITPERPKTKEIRRGLSDEEMGNLLASVGNHEAKAITLLVMGDGNICDSAELGRRVINSQGEDIGWRMSRITLFSYCTNSLSPIGLVTEETLNKGGLTAWGYQITEDGKEIGIPLAGLLLDFSERHNISLNRFLGATYSPSKNQTIQTDKGKVDFKKRSPSTTLKILRAIVDSSSFPIRQVDITRTLGESQSSLGPTLTRLSELDLIKYESKEVNKPYSLYKLSSSAPEEKPPTYRRETSLTQQVFHILKKNQDQDPDQDQDQDPDKYLTREQIYDLIPEEQKEKLNKHRLLTRISRILSFLNKHKYADIQKFHGLKQSEISITDRQKAVLTEFLDIIDGVQNQDPEIIKKGIGLAHEIIANPEKVSKLLRRAKEASGNANQSPQEETKRHILSIILSKPDGVTNKQIQELLLGEPYGKRLNIPNIRELSSSLQGDSIKVVKQGNVNIFFPNPNNPTSPSS